MPEKNGNSNVVLKLAVVLVVVVAAAWLALASFRPTAIVAIVKRDAAVDIVTGSVIVHASGDVLELKSEADGRVAWCEALIVGKSFKAGDELMRFDTEDLQREIKQAESDYLAATERRKIELKNDPRLQLAQKALDESTRYHDRHETSDQDFDKAKRDFEAVKTKLELENFDQVQAKTAYETAQATRKRLLEKMTPRAPVDLTVAGINVYHGALISKGATMVTYYATTRDVVAKFSEENAGKLAVGQRAKVRLLNYGILEFDAKVKVVLPFADADTQRYTAYLDVEPNAVPAEKLVPFGTGEVTVTVGERENQPLIPRRAVFSSREGTCVWVVKDGHVEKRKVTMGFSGLNIAEVKTGLEKGEQVIVDDLDQFSDGQRVRATPTTDVW